MGTTIQPTTVIEAYLMDEETKVQKIHITWSRLDKQNLIWINLSPKSVSYVKL